MFESCFHSRLCSPTLTYHLTLHLKFWQVSDRKEPCMYLLKQVGICWGQTLLTCWKCWSLRQVKLSTSVLISTVIPRTGLSASLCGHDLSQQLCPMWATALLSNKHSGGSESYSRSRSWNLELASTELPLNVNFTTFVTKHKLISNFAFSKFYTHNPRAPSKASCRRYWSDGDLFKAADTCVKGLGNLLVGFFLPSLFEEESKIGDNLSEA